MHPAHTAERKASSAFPVRQNAYPIQSDWLAESCAEWMHTVKMLVCQLHMCAARTVGMGLKNLSAFKQVSTGKHPDDALAA